MKPENATRTCDDLQPASEGRMSHCMEMSLTSVALQSGIFGRW
ncbi:hypothetical protein [Ileibacterium valens]|nr:hypothetical protein [Ileibacterium valens]